VNHNHKLNSWGIYFISTLSLHLLFLYSGKFLISPTACLLSDSWIIHSMAVNYIADGVMRYHEAGPTLFQLPLYPWFISIFYRIFGEDPRIIIVFQILVNAILISTILSYTKLFLGRWNLLLFLLFLFDIHSLLYTSCLITEFWIFAFWLVSWFFIACYEKSSEKKFWFLHIVCLSVMTWMKPIMGIWAPFSIIISFLLLPKVRFNWKLIVPGILLHGLLISPLFIRNYQVTGDLGRYSTISSYNAWYFNVVYHEADKTGMSIQDTRTKLVNKMREYINKTQSKSIPFIKKNIASDRKKHVEALGLKEYEYARIADIMVKKYMGENLFSYSANHLYSGLNIFTISNLSWFKLYYNRFEAFSFGSLGFFGCIDQLAMFNFKSYLLFVRIYEMFYVFFLLLFSLVYLIFERKNWIKSYFIQYGMMFIVYMTFISGVNVWGRFRYLFMPVLIYLGVCGVKSMYEYICNKDKLKVS